MELSAFGRYIVFLEYREMTRTFSNCTVFFQKIKCNTAKITTCVQTDDTFFDCIDFGKTEINEKHSTVEKFRNVLEKLRKSKNVEEYVYCAEGIESMAELWEGLKNQYHVEKEHE